MPTPPRNMPPSMQKYEMKDKAKDVVLSTWITIRKGKTDPVIAKTDPRMSNFFRKFILFVEPALDEMVGSRFEGRRLFDIAKTFYETVTPWVEPIPCRWID